MSSKRFYHIGFEQDDLGSSPPSIALLTQVASYDEERSQ